MIVIFTYQREQMLRDLVNYLKGERIIIIDDGSDYDPKGLPGYYRFTHQGREGFWRLWNEALKLCNDDWTLFLQDDVRDVNLPEIRRITSNLDCYAFNIMRRGQDRGWTDIGRTEVELSGVPCYQMGYADCIFATNREALDKIGRHMNPINPYRFVNTRLSSGVGQQLSKRFQKAGVPMYMPQKSLAYHGDHDSIMHPEERKLNPLISI